MRAVELLTANDRKALRRAMRERREMCLDREYVPTGVRLRVCVVPADPAWAPAEMLGRVEVHRGHQSSGQYCGSYPELLGLLKEVVL